MSSKDTQFKPGQSGNSKGRPRGSRNHVHQRLDAQLREHAEELVRKCLDDARTGDPHMRRLLLSYLLPRRTGRYLEVDIPDIYTADDVVDAQNRVMQQLRSGAITVEAAEQLIGLIERQHRAIETEKLEVRLSALEKEIRGEEL